MNELKAYEDCRAANVSFETAFRWQYLVTQNEISGSSLSRTAFCGWNVYTGVGVNVARLEDRSGRQIGIFLGIGVDQAGLIKGQYKVEMLDLDRDSFFNDFECWLNKVAGRYNILISNNGLTRFYSDAVGMNGMVYDRKTRQIASSLALCLNRPIIDHPLYDHERVEKGESNYTLFHTRDAHVKRGNPNFYLDLTHFSETRFWPRTSSFQIQLPYHDICKEIATRTKKVIVKINEEFTTALPISGGQDSRILAGLAGQEIHKIDQIFTHILNYSSRIDATIAGQMANILGVPHEIYDRRHTKVKKKDTIRYEAEYHAALGIKLPISREIEQQLHLGVSDGAVILRGHQTDLLRAVFTDRFGAKGRAQLRWQIKRLLIVPRKEFDNEIYEKFLPIYQTWIGTLPTNSRDHQIDLMFLEIYYSSTIGTTFPAFTRNFLLSPFNSRYMIELSLSIDEEYRRKSDAVNDILLMVNEDLHDVPFDYEFGGHRPLELIDDYAQMLEATETRTTASRSRRTKILKDANLPTVIPPKIRGVQK